MAEGISFDALAAEMENFISNAREEFQHRTDNWPNDLSHNEFHEVVGALLARQVTLATHIAISPNLWSEHVAPLILRAMADVYITLAWILKDPDIRSRKFIEYGLGQAKLMLEHRRMELGEQKGSPAMQEALDAEEAWINAQRLMLLTEVNVGSWSGISTREMAAEADCLDFYNYVYVPFSACAHSAWHHVARHNLKICRNPLHRGHSVAHMPEYEPHIHYVYLAGKYLQKAFAEFDAATNVTRPSKSAFQILCNWLEGNEHSSGGEGDAKLP
jgi:hypothetical protein